MMEADFGDYHLVALRRAIRGGRYAVSVRIEKSFMTGTSSGSFDAQDGISYLLEEEAAREALKLGRNLVKGGFVGF